MTDTMNGDAMHSALISANALIENQAAELKSLRAQMEATTGSDAYAQLEKETERLTQLVIELNDERVKASEKERTVAVEGGVWFMNSPAITLTLIALAMATGFLIRSAF